MFAWQSMWEYFLYNYLDLFIVGDDGRLLFFTMKILFCYHLLIINFVELSNQKNNVTSIVHKRFVTVLSFIWAQTIK